MEDRGGRERVKNHNLDEDGREREREREEKIKERMRTESEMDRFARNAAWKAWNTSGGGGCG